MRARVGLALLIAAALIAAIVARRQPAPPPEEEAAAAASALRVRAEAPQAPQPAPPPLPPEASPAERLERLRHSVEGVGVSQVEMEQLLALLSEGGAQVSPLGVACGPPPCVLGFSYDAGDASVAGTVRDLAGAFIGADGQAELAWDDGPPATGYLWFVPSDADDESLAAMRQTASLHRAGLSP